VERVERKAETAVKTAIKEIKQTLPQRQNELRGKIQRLLPEAASV